MTSKSVFCSPTLFCGRNMLWLYWNKEMHFRINLCKLVSNIEWLTRKLILTISKTVSNHELYSTLKIFFFYNYQWYVLSILSCFFFFFFYHFISLMKNSFYTVHTFLLLIFSYKSNKTQIKEKVRIVLFSTRPIMNIFICT